MFILHQCYIVFNENKFFSSQYRPVIKGDPECLYERIDKKYYIQQHCRQHKQIFKRQMQLSFSIHKDFPRFLMFSQMLSST